MKGRAEFAGLSSVGLSNLEQEKEMHPSKKPENSQLNRKISIGKWWFFQNLDKWSASGGMVRSVESKIAQKSIKKKVKTIWHDNIDISKTDGSIFSADMGIQDFLK